MDGIRVIERADDAQGGGDSRQPDTVMQPSPAAPRRKPRKARQFWLRQLHTWHWISAAVSLVGMFLFAITGITLNHASSISAEPKVVSRQAALPPALRGVLAAGARKDAPVPEPVAASLVDLVGLDVRGHAAEWNDDEVYVALPGPGRDAWVSIDRQTGEVTSERTDRGWVSYFNDLHKGRNSGAAWFWFIDLFAAACVIFTLTGLLLLQLHARHRPSTWPLVALGTAIPLVIALFLIH